MSHHEHHGCEHSVAYCKRCDVVYCRLCNREWGGASYWYTTYPYYPRATIGTTWGTTTGSTTAAVGNITLTGGCSHQES